MSSFSQSHPFYYISSIDKSRILTNQSSLSHHYYPIDSTLYLRIKMIKYFIYAAALLSLSLVKRLFSFVHQ